MTAVFWAVVLLGILWLAYNVTSDRRNPPMKRCDECDGTGLIRADFNFGRVDTYDCIDCVDGWVER